MTLDVNSLIGGAPEDTPEDELAEICKQVAAGRASFVDAGVLKRPVTQNFLALVFDMDPATVKKRLLQVKPVGYGGTAKQPRPLYDFKEACSHLVEPKIDLEAYIKSLDVNKLPNLLNKMFWEGQHTRLRFFLASGQAWATEDVLEVLGELFMMVKDQMLTIPEHLRDSGVSDDVCETVRNACDNFQKSLHEHLIELPKTRQTMHIFADDPALKSARPVSDAGDE